MELTIATYNTQYCTGLDNKTSVNRIAEEVKDVDIIGLQEIERFWKRTDMQDQVELLTELFEDRYVFFGPAMDADASIRLQDNKIQNRRRQFGNMVISRWPITKARVPLLPKHHLLRQMSIQRSVIDAVINIDDRPIRLLCTHLGHASISERLEQIAALKNIIQAGRSDGGSVTGPNNADWELSDQLQETPKTTVLLGDFNFTPSSEEYAALVGRKNPIYGVETLIDGLQDLWPLLHGDEPAITHVGRNPKQLDYIFATEGLASVLKDIRVIEEATGSDHKPVMASFEI